MGSTAATLTPELIEWPLKFAAPGVELVGRCAGVRWRGRGECVPDHHLTVVT
jgi:hypothetical protein